MPVIGTRPPARDERGEAKVSALRGWTTPAEGRRDWTRSPPCSFVNPSRRRPRAPRAPRRVRQTAGASASYGCGLDAPRGVPGTLPGDRGARSTGGPYPRPRGYCRATTIGGGSNDRRFQRRPSRVRCTSCTNECAKAQLVASPAAPRR